MKYEIRWWATKKEVNKTDSGYNQEKVDRGGETQVNGREEALGFVNTMLEMFDDMDYIELKVLRLGEESE